MPISPGPASLIGVLVLFAGCATQPTMPAKVTAVDNADVSECIGRLGHDPAPSAGELNGPDFSIVNWNIRKGKHAGWAGDLAGLHRDPALLILQEASPRHDAWEALAPGHHRSFAEGFGIRDSTTGVMTVSAARPVSECQLVSLEPWFSTRKATLVTEYALTNSDQNLLVLNIHAINFTFGVGGLEKQLRKAQRIIDAHNGPVIFSGDFNTWRGRRTRMLDELLQDVGLTRLAFSIDHRKRFRGWPLDHVYVRGLDTLQATTQALESSDHNPMIVRLALAEPQPSFAASP
jgi:endonuclease/exonuclease/phosphatase (EEP) superfamily protein YafD